LDWATGPLWKVDRTARVGLSEGFAPAQISSLDKPLHHHHRAMTHASGGENTKLPTTTAGIQKNACCDSAGVVKTVTSPTPKTTALTMAKIRAATRRRPVVIGHPWLLFVVQD
jgi:hypothetical protein